MRLALGAAVFAEWVTNKDRRHRCRRRFPTHQPPERGDNDHNLANGDDAWTGIPPVHPKTMMDSFCWGDDNLHTLRHHLFINPQDKHFHFGAPDGPILGPPGVTLPKLFLDIVAERTLSLGYAGIDAPSTSIMMQSLAAADKINQSGPVPKPRVLWAFENDPECQKELMRHPCGVEKIFGDLRALWVPSIKKTLDGLEDRRAIELLQHLGPWVVALTFSPTHPALTEAGAVGEGAAGGEEEEGEEGGWRSLRDAPFPVRRTANLLRWRRSYP